MDDFDGLGGEVSEATQAVRTEVAGIIGLTTCRFDGLSGERISTTRAYEHRQDITEMLGVVGHVTEEAARCPFFDVFKCPSCPDRNDDD